MPGRDGTGPMGDGTGRGRNSGLCAVAGVNRYGAKLGRRLGLGRQEMLRKEKELLQKRIDIISEELVDSNNER